jgi:hypothetical protein
MATLRQILATLRSLVSDPARHLRAFKVVGRALIRAIVSFFRPRRLPPRRRRGDCCIHLPPDVYKRPDPLIYDQYYLMKMGLAVTWDNPDIQLYEFDPSAPDGVGAPVSSAALLPGRPYKVRVRVWNGSYDAPAVGLPVRLSFLTFGAATTSTPIGTTFIDLGVKGSPHEPAFAVCDWTTPTGPGHYCLQARLEWADDANPDNNLGQENLNVVAAHSPAVFSFLLRNEASVRRRFAVEADAYRLPGLPRCDEIAQTTPNVPAGTAPTRLAESRSRWERARRAQGYGRFPIPDGWTVTLEPHELVLAAFAEREIEITIDPHDDDPTGKPLNLHTFALADDGERVLVGGVTVSVTKS